MNSFTFRAVLKHFHADHVTTQRLSTLHSKIYETNDVVLPIGSHVTFEFLKVIVININRRSSPESIGFN